MADKSSIEWTGATWNPITGCAIASPGCIRCYAMRLAGTRLKHHPSRKGLTQDTKAGPVWTGEVRFNREWLDQPLRWKRPRKIFVCAHGDLFAENVPDEWIDQVFGVMALAPQHTFQVLTKRAARMREYVSRTGTRSRIALDALEITLVEHVQDAASEVGSGCIIQGDIPHLKVWPLPNVWLGVSAEDQRRADERIPDLLATPAAIRFVSVEPLLGPVDLTAIRWKDEDAEIRMNALTAEAWVENSDSASAYTDEVDGNTRLDWIIAGGESGTGARPMHPAWARSLRDQCAAAGVPFFFKQWGAFRPLTQAEHGQACGATLVGNDPHDPDAYLLHVGKKAAGRLLDGREHSEFPRARP